MFLYHPTSFQEMYVTLSGMPLIMLSLNMKPIGSLSDGSIFLSKFNVVYSSLFSLRFWPSSCTSLVVELFVYSYTAMSLLFFRQYRSRICSPIWVIQSFLNMGYLPQKYGLCICPSIWATCLSLNIHQYGLSLCPYSFVSNMSCPFILQYDLPVCL